MAQSGLLYSLAEIAVTIAGFSAIVVLFKRSDSGTWRPADADRFNGMLIHAMAAVFFCVLPSLIAVFETNEGTIWSIASAVLGVQIVGHAIVIFRLEAIGLRGRLFLVMALGAAVLQILNVFAIHFSREFGPYLVGVLWHVLHAGGLFVSLVWARSSDTRSE